MRQKDTNWEGAWRAPCFMRRPCKIESGTVLERRGLPQDMLPTMVAIAGERTSAKLTDSTWCRILTGEVKERPRDCFFCVSDDGRAILRLMAKGRARHSNFGRAKAERILARNKSGPACRALY